MTCDSSVVFLGTPVSSCNKTDRRDATDILLKVALQHHKPKPITNPFYWIRFFFQTVSNSVTQSLPFSLRIFQQKVCTQNSSHICQSQSVIVHSSMYAIVVCTQNSSHIFQSQSIIVHSSMYSIVVCTQNSSHICQSQSVIIHSSMYAIVICTQNSSHICHLQSVISRS